MAKQFVNKSEYDAITNLKQRIDNGEVIFKKEYDKLYALDVIAEFMHSWNKLQASNAKHDNDICTRTIKNLRNMQGSIKGGYIL